MLPVLLVFFGAASCSSDSGSSAPADACTLLRTADFGVDIVEYKAFEDGPDVLGCRASVASPPRAIRLHVHRRDSYTEAQEFGESYLSNPPADDPNLGSGFAKIRSGSLVLVLETYDLGYEQLEALALAAADLPLEFGSKAGAGSAAPAVTTPQSKRVISSLSLIIESQDEAGVCYRIESEDLAVVASNCFSGRSLRVGEPPVRFMSKDSFDERVVWLYAIGDGFEVLDVLVEPQDVEWGAAPAGWLLVTTASDAPIQLVMRSGAETIICHSDLVTRCKLAG